MKTILENSSSSIAERLREERKKLGLTQEEFGHLGGVTKTAQSLFEGGKNRPGSEYLEALHFNGVDVGFIVTGTRYPKENLDWKLLRHAFLFIQHSFAERTDRKYTADQLFEAFKSVVEVAMGSTRPDLIEGNGHTPNKAVEKLGE
ncbi:MAG: helix-turn-helix domain-containing protein [Methylotenera sp.]